MLKPPQGQGHTVKELRSGQGSRTIQLWTRCSMNKIQNGCQGPSCKQGKRLGDLTNIMHLLILFLNSSTRTMYSNSMHTVTSNGKLLITNSSSSMLIQYQWKVP